MEQQDESVGKTADPPGTSDQGDRQGTPGAPETDTPAGENDTPGTDAI